MTPETLRPNHPPVPVSDISGALDAGAASDAADMWRERACRTLASDLGQAQFDAWFAGAEFVQGPPPTVVMSSAFRASWVTDHFGRHLRRAFGDDVQVTHRKPQPQYADDEDAGLFEDR